MAEITALLKGGSRDGESTIVASEVRRLFAHSDAPGLLDVYEITQLKEHLRGNEDEAVVFEFAGQEDAAAFSPEDVHLPLPS